MLKQAAWIGVVAALVLTTTMATRSQTDAGLITVSARVSEAPAGNNSWDAIQLIKGCLSTRVTPEQRPLRPRV